MVQVRRTTVLLNNFFFFRTEQILLNVYRGLSVHELQSVPNRKKYKIITNDQNFFPSVTLLTADCT